MRAIFTCRLPISIPREMPADGDASSRLNLSQHCLVDEYAKLAGQLT